MASNASINAIYFLILNIVLVSFRINRYRYVFGLGLNVLSIATPHWLRSRYVGHHKGPSYDIGIFQHCEIEEKSCGGLDGIHTMINPSDIAWFSVIQATFILSVIGCLLSTVMAIFFLIKIFDTSKSGYKLISVTQLLTLTSQLIALTLFGMDCVDMFAFDGHVVQLSWAYYCAAVACGFIFLSSIMHAMEASRAVEVIKNVHHRLAGLTSNYTLFVDQDP
ncbi:hypothetical protein LOTGIDRAFT_169568 [Lottia gigantea]|uniref:Uncharacterized protein n=1 Tax=Lottia gigantea TaxID=225164 RepID=V3YYD9_LOTGI|nr:hypothetical protein LOTGIDRAFT_169568 [Lottia gigantea]ESO83158.1 hypothetical protein LOTGIDRAFT_169568 [Lottia gigantea]